jgi:hypothetical protein
MRDVDSFRVRDHPISTNPVTLSVYSFRPWLLSNFLAPICPELSPSRFPRETSKPLPPSLDKRLLTAARLPLPVTRLVLPAMSLSPVVCIPRCLASEHRALTYGLDL